MQNDVWNEVGAFLNNLRCGNVERKTYIRFPELVEAENLKKKMEEKYSIAMKEIEPEYKKQIENYLESIQHLSFMGEEQAYCQGYADCIQLLAGLGILNSNSDIEDWIRNFKQEI